MNPQKLLPFLFVCFTEVVIIGQTQAPFVSKPLEEKGDLSALMVKGINNFLTAETERVKKVRPDLWQRDFSSPAAFDRSVAPQRDFLAQRLGVADAREKPDMEVLTGINLQQIVTRTSNCSVRPVRWKVLNGLDAEGLLLSPVGNITARAVFIPDADIQPEALAGLVKSAGQGDDVALRLAGQGWEIIIPVLVSRSDTYSGSDIVGRYTNQPHREWIYRQGFEVGRHVTGYELQKIFAAIDWMESRNKAEGRNVPIGVAGYGEGGMLALYAGALDHRISSTLVSGYFNARERLWSEPIYRNVFGLLKYFGDAELAVMHWPGRLVIEHSAAPEISGPPAVIQGRSGGAAPGRLTTPDINSAQAEWNRAKAMLPSGNINISWINATNGTKNTRFTEPALKSFASGMGIGLQIKQTALQSVTIPADWPDASRRQERTVRGIEHHIQRVLALCDRQREKDFWGVLKGGVEEQKEVKSELRDRFRDVIGRLPTPSLPANPRSRLIKKAGNWTGYEVVLDVWPDVFAWGILLIPDDLKPDEKRPVVVCQHGLEGLPADVVTTDPGDDAFRYYQGFASRLADKGYVVFAPHNPYRGGDDFRVLQRLANPLGLSLFSVITGQHQRIVEWLGDQSFVDPSRIGYYGLSYGGKAAMRLPALIEGYALSICSGDFNDWVRKNASTDHRFTYMFTGEYEIFEWDLGHTFNYAEMAGLIASRPFMVERGHNDGVGIDEWVAYEFAKVNRHYDLLGLDGSCRIEYFNGPHMIHGVGTFEFLDRHLGLKP